MKRLLNFKPVRTALLCALITQSAQAACTVDTPVISGASAYTYVADSVQSVTLNLACSAVDRPVLTFSSPGGSFDSTNSRYTGTINAGSDTLSFYIPDAYNSALDPTKSSFRFQVIYPQNQWGAPSRSYSGPLTVIVTF